MNDRMQLIAAVAATVLYQRKGIIAALTYLEGYNWTRDEALDLLVMVDNFNILIDRDQLT